MGFKLDNISSILSGSGSNLAASIAILTDAKTIDKFKQLEKLGFKLDNISSILNGSGSNLAASIKILTDANTIEKFQQLKNMGFKIDNTSSILNGSGSNLAASIEILTDANTIEKFQQLKELGFKPDNISSILNGSGSNLVASIKILTDANIITQFNRFIKHQNNQGGILSTKIAQKLIKTLINIPNNKLAQQCDELWKFLEQLQTQLLSIKNKLTYDFSNPKFYDHTIPERKNLISTFIKTTRNIKNSLMRDICNIWSNDVIEQLNPSNAKSQIDNFILKVPDMNPPNTNQQQNIVADQGMDIENAMQQEESQNNNPYGQVYGDTFYFNEQGDNNVMPYLNKDLEFLDNDLLLFEKFNYSHDVVSLNPSF